MTREYTVALLEQIDQGILDPVKIVEMCMAYMSEYDVKDMLISNELDILDSDDEESDEDDYPDETD